MIDAQKKGRFASGLLNGTKTHPQNLRRGESHGNVKLTWKKVILIRKIAALGKHGIQTMLAKKFNVSNSTISHIINDLIWKTQPQIPLTVSEYQQQR